MALTAVPAGAAAVGAPPLAGPSPLPYQAPPFDRLRDADLEPALAAAMALQRKDFERIATDPRPATFDNTLVALERSGERLDRIKAVLSSLVSSNTNPALDRIDAAMAPQLAAQDDALLLDERLFARVAAVHAQQQALPAGTATDAESRRLVERYLLRFERAGARLPEADKQKVRALNGELASLQNAFGRQVKDDTQASAVVVTDRAELDGLDGAAIAAAARAAEDRGLRGQWLLGLQNTSLQPVLASLKNRALRERIYRASVERGSHGGPNDTTEIVTRIVRLRAERARLLGHASFAGYALADQMARTPEAATALLRQIAPAAVANAKAEAADIQALIDSQAQAAGTPTFALQPWDWHFYAEQVRKARHDLDEAQLRPYFEWNSVLQRGVFVAAARLYGVHLKQRTDLPTYLPDVQVFEVSDAHGTAFGLVYIDRYARDNKRGGAWMSSYVDQSTLLGTGPVVTNNLNIVKPAAGDPTLLTFDEVTTTFHEFGHALHGLLSRVRYPLFSGTQTPRDFVEFPSQINENWALVPEVLASYARHYRTGQPMPPALVEKIKAAGTFGQGYATVEYLGAALVDLAWHALPADAPPQDVLAFEAKVLHDEGLDVPGIPPRYRSPYFNHVFGGDYAAGYYAYLWADVLAQDGFAWFTEHGGLQPANGAHFAATVLSRGGTDDAARLYQAFRGRAPDVGPLLKKRGLAAAAPPAVAVRQ